MEEKRPEFLSLQQEAANEKTMGDRLTEFAKVSTELARLVAQNPSSPAQLLRELGESSDATTRENVALNPNTPTQVLQKLGDEFSKEVLDNPVLPLLFLENPSILDELFQPDTLGSLVLDTQTPKEVLGMLIYSKHIQLAEAAQLHVNWAGEMTFGWDEAACEAIPITTIEYQETEYIRNLERKYIRHLANRALIPAPIINQLVRYKGIRSLIAPNPNTSLKRPKRLAKNNDVSERIACNPNIPVELLEQLAQDKNSGIRLYVAMNSNAPVHLLELLAQDEIAGIRTHVAKNPNTPVQLLELLAQDEDKWIRRSVASNPNIPLMLLNQLLNQLAQDENHAIREFVAGHPKTPVSLLLEVTLKLCPQSSTPSLSRFLVLLHPQAPYPALGKYYCSKIWLERYAIAQNPNTPLDILHTLAKDANRIVRAAAKAHLQHRFSKP